MVPLSRLSLPKSCVAGPLPTQYSAYSGVLQLLIWILCVHVAYISIFKGSLDGNTLRESEKLI